VNLAESEKWKAPAKGRRCIVCGESCARFRNGPWLMSLVAGAQAHALTIKAPDATSYHDACGAHLQVLINRKRKAAKLQPNEVSQ
jgi:hypothetical protein